MIAYFFMLIIRGFSSRSQLIINIVIYESVVFSQECEECLEKVQVMSYTLHKHVNSFYNPATCK